MSNATDSLNFGERQSQNTLIKTAVAGVVLLLVSFVWRGRQVNPVKRPDSLPPVAITGASSSHERSLARKLRESGKRFAFVYGSQTGTAKRFAQSTAREARNRYGVTSVVCSIDEYDWDDLGDFTADSIVCFFMATYGEGEPTDSAIAFTQRLLDKSIVFSNGATSIPAFRYVMFGCGNRSYDQFNQAAIDIDRRLMELGATRVGHVGLGDHDKSIDDDYERWVMVLWPELSTVAGLVEGHEAPTGMYVIKETTHLDQMGEGVHHGDLSDEAPFLAPVISTRSLMSPTADRTCVHLELGLEGSGMSYSAGDHVGIWPSNPDREVDRILGILGLNKESAIQVTSIDPESFQVPFPSPATYLAIFRHYLDICSPPSHSVLSLVATFAPSPAAVERMRSIATSMSEAGLTLGETLCLASGATVDGKGRMDSDAGLETWRIPMDTIITILPRLQPRYYSISSSPRLYPSSAHLTAVTLKYQNALPASGDARWVHGVGSNFLLQIQRSAQSQVPGDDSPTYTLDGPNGTHRVNNALHIPIRIRQSKFRLPASSRIPIIMIGPGTGVAPFRGFVQERVAMARDVKKRGGSIATWAPILLFCGARRRDEEWLYSEEWTEYAAELNGKLQVHCAFSRETDTKVYVQDKLWDARELVAELITKRRAMLYICGDAKLMCRQVETRLAEILSLGASIEKGQEEIHALKLSKRILTDVW